MNIWFSSNSQAHQVYNSSTYSNISTEHLVYPILKSIESSLSHIKASSMGQRGSKMHMKEPAHYASAHSNRYSDGHPVPSYYDPYAAEQYKKEQRKQQMKKRSRKNGVIAATAGAA